MRRSAAPHPAHPHRRRARATVAALVALAGVLLAIAGPAAPASAQSGAEPRIVWSVQPSSESGPTSRPYFVYEQAPGTTLTDVVAVTNLSDIELVFDLYATDAYNDGEGGYALRTSDEDPSDVGSWVTLGGTQVTIPPNSRADIPFSIQVPGDAEPGDHAGGIVASLRSSTTNESGGSVAVEQRVGTRVYLRVPGELRPSLTISDLSASHASGLNPVAGQPVQMTYTVANTGNVILGAHSLAEIDGPFGRQLGATEGDDVPELLPGSTLERTITVDGIPSWGRMDGAVVLEPFSTVTPAGTVDLVERSTTVWSVPWLLVALVVLAGGGLSYWMWRRRTGGTGGTGGSGTPASGAPTTGPPPSAPAPAPDREPAGSGSAATSS
jgi:hypothetical protein